MKKGRANKNAHIHNHTHDACGHIHGIVDPAIFTTQRGIWDVKWSFLGLSTTALFQIVIVLLSGSVALLADTIHNIGDASTAIPLWLALTLAREIPSKRFTYSYGRTGRWFGQSGSAFRRRSSIKNIFIRLSYPFKNSGFVGGYPVDVFGHIQYGLVS